MSEISDLQAQIAELKNELQKYKGSSGRDKIDKMSSEVVDSNPYSRLMVSFRHVFVYPMFPNSLTKHSI